MRYIKFVIKENFNNIQRIFSIAKYEILAENRDSKLGMFWSIITPFIQILSYWFAFGLGIRGGQAVDGVQYINWMLVGICCWFFISASIRNGTNSIHGKANIITKIKFPVSIFPTISIVKELFNHFIMIILVYLYIVINGIRVNRYNLQLIYYIFCGAVFSISISLVLSVLNMFSRDVKKAVNASIRLLTFVTPILWTMDKLPLSIQKLMRYNPIYYLVDGYRDSLLFYNSVFDKSTETIIFWIIVCILFTSGSILMYKFKHKFIDFI